MNTPVMKKSHKKVKLHTLTGKDIEVEEFAALIEKLHHKFRGKQRIAEAKKIRRQLRKAGLYLSRIGHHGGLHD